MAVQGRRVNSIHQETRFAGKAALLPSLGHSFSGGRGRNFDYPEVIDWPTRGG
jgi:hypothetical protein